MGEAKRRKKAGTYPYKRDTGIARLPNGMPIREELRDGINARIDKDTGEYKRIHTPGADKQGSIVRLDDTRTTSELQQIGWNGIRQNAISRQTEIWLHGEIRKRIPSSDLERNPGLLASAMEELFPGFGHVIQVDAEQFYREPMVYKGK